MHAGRGLTSLWLWDALHQTNTHLGKLRFWYVLLYKLHNGSLFSMKRGVITISLSPHYTILCWKISRQGTVCGFNQNTPQFLSVFGRGVSEESEQLILWRRTDSNTHREPQRAACLSTVIYQQNGIWTDHVSSFQKVFGSALQYITSV